MKLFIPILLLFCSMLEAQNLISNEQFADCSLPGKWELATNQGNFGFSILKSNLFPKTDATCSILYQQTNNSNSGIKEFSITTKEFKLYNYDEYSFSFDLRFMRPSSIGTLNLGMIVDGIFKNIQSFSSPISHPTQIVVNQKIPLTGQKKANSIKFVFHYLANGNDYNNEIIVDNIFLSGPDNDDCTKAFELIIDDPCVSGNSTGASLSGPPVQCSGQYIQGLWYKFTSDYDGYIKIKNISSYNDAISFYKGSCSNLEDLACLNQDEYGFEGEQNYIEVQSGTSYYLRITKQIGFYGREDIDDLCIAIEKIDPQYPAHDKCNESIGLSIGNNCTLNSNYIAHFDKPVPSLNERSRADVWYHFSTTSSNPLEIISHADFADVITLYKGTCDNLVEQKCEDLGNRLILLNPIPNTIYKIQLSGYFSSIEGNLCVEIKEKTTSTPTNDDCPTARAIELNKLCQISDNLNANASKIKGSCVVFNAPDIWYSFIAPSEKAVSLDIDAGFIYHYTVYSGTCSNLTEISCGSAPDPCGDYIYLNGLNPGKTYYLQVISTYKPIQSIEAQICVRINEFSKTIAKQSLDLQLTTECLHGVLGKVSYTASGGSGIYKYYGPDQNQLFLPGEKVEAFIEDEKGCRDFAQAVISCTPPSHCANSSLDIELDFECLVDSIGRQTGEVIIHIAGKGGSGAYYNYGTKDGEKLNHGDPFQIVLIDSDSCYVIEEGKIVCPPFDCSQSNLSIAANYDCIDTLLKAKLNLTVKGNLGSFQLTGNSDGDLLKAGDRFNTSVIDQAGCAAQISGEIICNFDSCAYSRPSLVVDYECLLDSLGNRTGKAVLHVEANSYAGGVVISGNKNGDTLYHTEKYDVNFVDSFGCSLSLNGVISCVPVNVKSEFEENHLSVYPNPTGSEVKIEFHNLNDPKLNLSIFSQQGIEVINLQINQLDYKKSLQIPMDKFPSGIYYIKVKGNEFFDIIRLIKI